MKHLSLLFVTFLAAATPAQSAELSRLCEPYAWANMRVKKADGTLLLWEDLRADIKNDQKIAQAIVKNKYSDADLQTAFNNAKKTVKARYDAQRYEVFSDVMAHILAPFTKRFSKNKGIEICMKMLSRESACAGENADLQKYLDGINGAFWFDDYLEHKNKSDYRDWKSKSTITDRREYHLKALYNAHEDLAQAGRKLVDFWVENSEKVLKVSDNGASQRRPAEMRKALEDYGVAELILRRVFDADPKD
jgi:hypothetical protein